MSKGGSKTQTTNSASETKLPEWLTTAAQGAVDTATGLSQREYQPYTGQILATPSADTEAYGAHPPTPASERAVGQPWASGDATTSAQDDDISTSRRDM